jgi:hypothetical protein
VAALSPLRGPHEPDPLVVVHRANGELALRELADPQAIVGSMVWCMRATVRRDATSVSSRFLVKQSGRETRPTE